MKIPPSYIITPQMLALIAKIETERLHIASLNLPKPLKEKIQRVSLLKSSLFSARIEGNPLELADVEVGDKKSQKKLEVFNITESIRFLDGNGRVGRLLIAAILKSRGWDFTFTVPFEEYLDNHKDDYYFHLDKGLGNTDDYLLFMLEAFWQQIQAIKAQIDQELEKDQKVFLPPRQEEIYSIIGDHRVVSFDMIRRRFTRVPERTLRWDLKKLLDRKLIEKSGETKGRYYRVRK